MVAFDVEWCRRQFPALGREVGGRPAIFLDGPGGTQVPQRVIDAVSGYLAGSNANCGGAFATSRETDRLIAETRAATADFLGCEAGEIVFGPNMTTLTFALARSIGRELAEGDEIVVTRMDHDANIAPWRALEELGVHVVVSELHEEDCTLDLEDLEAKIGSRTRLVAVPYASNAVGTINDVRRIVGMAHAAGAMAFVDAVHYAPHGPIDVGEIGCDFLGCSPYKFFGPHQGVIFGKREHLDRLLPYKVRPATDRSPERWETGTQNHECLAGVGAALDYLAELGRRAAGSQRGRRGQLLAAMEAIRDYERGLSERLIPGLLALPGIAFAGIRDAARFDRRTPTISMRLDGITPTQLATRLGEAGIFTWHGNYYALELSERLGMEPEGMLRIGLVHYNTAAEIDRLLEELSAAVRS